MKQFTQKEIDDWLEANTKFHVPGYEYNLIGIILIDIDTCEHLEFMPIVDGDLQKHYKSNEPSYIKKYGPRQFGQKFIQHSKYKEIEK